MTDTITDDQPQPPSELDAVLDTILDDFVAAPGNINCVRCSTSIATVRSAHLDPAQFSWCAHCFGRHVARRVLYELGRTDQVTELTGVLHRVYHLLEEGPPKEGGLIETAIVPAMTLIEQTAERFPECADMPLAETPVEPAEVVETSHAPIATFPLGIEARDTVSGWEGRIVGAYAYLNGCVRYEIGSSDKDGKPESFVFDEAQIEITDGDECPMCLLPWLAHTDDQLLTCVLDAYEQGRPPPEDPASVARMSKLMADMGTNLNDALSRVPTIPQPAIGPLPLLRPGAQYPTPAPAARTGGPRDSTPPPR